MRRKKKSYDEVLQNDGRRADPPIKDPILYQDHVKDDEEEAGVHEEKSSTFKDRGQRCRVDGEG